MAAESDSIPRIALPDLFLALREFEHEPVRSLEDVRLKICSSRKKPRPEIGIGQRPETTPNCSGSGS
jgi:hypothetical protein